MVFQNFNKLLTGEGGAMPSSLLRLNFYLFFSVLAATFSWPAFSQSCSGSACEANDPRGNACRVFFTSSTGDGAISGDQQPQGCYDPNTAYALQGFRLHAAGGQKLNRIGLSQDDEGASFAFLDADGGDAAQGYAWLMPLPEGTEIQSVTAPDCAGVCLVPLGPIGDDVTFVLSGFEFARASGEGNIEQLAIGPIFISPTGIGALSVDFREAEFTYSARIDYALVPTSVLEGPNSVGGEYRGGSVALVGLSGGENTILQGFSFNFKNGGKQLVDIGLELSNFGYEAWFQDQQPEANRRKPDDPFDWKVDYLIQK